MTFDTNMLIELGNPSQSSNQLVFRVFQPYLDSVTSPDTTEYDATRAFFEILDVNLMSAGLSFQIAFHPAVDGM